MTQAEFNYVYIAYMTVTGYEAGAAVSRNYFLTSKRIDLSHACWPILRSVGEVTLQAGELLPSAAFSSLQVDNARGSFGANRKLSDVFARYSPVEQPIELYVAQLPNDRDDAFSYTWTLIGKGVVASWDVAIADGAPVLNLSIRATKYDEKVLTLELTESVVATLPDSSKGRVVPLIVGIGNDVIPIRITADGGTTGGYAWGTTLYNLAANDSSSASVYTKNFDDQWEVIDNNAFDTTAGGPDNVISIEPRLYASVALSLGQTGYGGRSLVTAVDFVCSGGGGSASIATLSAFIIRYNRYTYTVVEEMARGRAQLNQYDTQNYNGGTSGNLFTVRISFDQVAFLSDDEDRYRYAIGVEATDWQVGDLSLCTETQDGARRFVKYGQDATEASSSTEWKTAASGVVFKAKLQTVSFLLNDNVTYYSDTGLGYSSLTLTQVTADAGQVAPIFDSLPLMLGNVHGMDSLSPELLVKTLSYTWAGPGGGYWVDSESWDDGALPTHYSTLYAISSTANTRARIAKGVFDQKVTFSQVVSEICRATASRVGILSTGESFLYPWGLTDSVAANIPPADISGLQWQQRDISTVVNRAVISVGRSPRYNSRDDQADGETVLGYQYTTDFSATNSTGVAALTDESRAVYGVRDLATGTFPIGPYAVSPKGEHLGGPGSVLAEYYLARYGKPLVYCSFVVPWHRYSDLQMFDVITFSHPDFPAYYGTDPNQALPAVNTGTQVVRVDPFAGAELTRCETYRGLVEGVSYVLAMEHAPALRLTVQVLVNHPKDPT